MAACSEEQLWLGSVEIVGGHLSLLSPSDLLDHPSHSITRTASDSKAVCQSAFVR
jgi:hypothetical protein